MVDALLGIGVPPSSVYAPLSVLPLPCPFASQFTKRTASYQPTKTTGLFANPLLAAYVRLPSAPLRVIPPSALMLMFVLYSPSGSVAALALRNWMYWLFVT